MTALIKDEEGDYIQHDELFQAFIDYCDRGGCVFGCCGYSNCDFSPAHIVGFLIAETSLQYLSDQESCSVSVLVDKLILQTHTLKAEFGSNGIINHGFEHESCAEYYPGEVVDELCDDIIQNTHVAYELIKISDSKAAPKRHYKTRDQIELLDRSGHK